MHLSLTLALFGLLPAPSVLCAPPTDVRVRARAWATILAINDLSCRSVESRDRVVFHLPDGTQFPFLEYEVRADVFRNVRMLGTVRRATSRDLLDEAEPSPVAVSLTDGVSRAVNHRHESGISRPESPDLIYAWTLPGPLTGLGRFVNLSQLRHRSDHLRDCSDLHVETELDGVAVLVGIGRIDERLFRHRVEVSSETGDVLRHTVFNLTWETPFVRWDMSKWTAVNDVRIPTHTEYRVYELNLSEEIRRKVQVALAASGLGVDSMKPDHPDFAHWVAIRDEIVPDKAGLTKLGADWQSCDSEILGVNHAFGDNWFALSAQMLKLDAWLSTVVEGEVDNFGLEPSPGAGSSRP